MSLFVGSGVGVVGKKMGRRAAAIAACVEGLEARRLMAATIRVVGGSDTIPQGDTTPNLLDFTDFGNTASAGGTLTRSFAIINGGDATLNISGVTIDGANASDFTVTSTATSVLAGGTDGVNITFDPHASGLRFARVNIASDLGVYSFAILGTADMVNVGSQGLRYMTLTPGSGRAVQNDDSLIVDYTGKLSDNATVFDTSLQASRGPFSFVDGQSQVIAGWDQGLVGAQPGETRVLVIPSALAYGPQARTGIPANSMLLFTVDVRRVVASSTPALVASGNSVIILSGDMTPSTADGTDFGAVAGGTSVVTRSFGLAPLTPAVLQLAGNPSITIGGANAAGFSVSGLVALPGGRTGINVTFNPTSPGVRTATVSVRTTDPTSPYTFDVTANGSGPVASAAPAPGAGTATEGPGSQVSFVVTLSQASASPVTVNYATANGTAVAGSDFTALSGTVTFAAGETSKTIIVPIIDDTVGEGTETFAMTLTGVAGGFVTAGSGATATGTIVDNDALTVSVQNASVVEGNSGTADLVFTVTLSAAATGAVSVAYAAGGGTATAGSDYTATEGVLNFAAGETSKTVVVPVIGDAEVEADETLVLTLSSPSGATLGTSTAVGTIANDDAPVASLPTITVGNASVSEGNAGTNTLAFPVTLSGAIGSAVTFTYATSGGTATAGTDYVAAQGTVTIPAGATTATIVVTVNGDNVDEADETVVLALTGAAGATLGAGQATGTIVDDDEVVVAPVVPTVSVADVSVVEGNSGTKDLVFTVTLSAASATPVVVNYATSDGTAAAGSDYTAAAGTLTIPAGQTSGIIVVSVTGDAVVEPSETVVLTVSHAVGDMLVPSTATGTIVNDDGPDLAVAVTSLVVSPKGLLVGGKGTAKVQVSNKGGVAFSGAPVVRWYLSQDGVLDGGDTLVGSVTKAMKLSANGARPTTLPANFVVPAGTAAGTYRLLAVVDPDGAINEADETNNAAVSAGTIAVLPSVVDLQVAHNPRGPKVAKGKKAALNVSVLNKGTVPFSGNTSIRFTASADGVADASDIVLGTLTKRLTVKNGSKAAAVLSVLIPGDLPPGTYRVIAQVDSGGVVAESDEGNNVAVSSWTFTV
jgi:hypothetical protein